MLIRASLRVSAIVALLAVPGCGVVWDSGGHRHAIGLGYVSWPVTGAELRTVVQGVDVAGIGLLATKGQVGVIAGYSRERSVDLDDNSFVILDCLHCDLVNARAYAGHVKPEEKK